jgi:pSer/pThr/pTyr-binding forkhead associated (FHA) protein
MITPHILVQLIHIQGGLKGEIQEFCQTPITVGRLSSCHVRFPADEPGVSREHARIEREGNQFRLTDQSRFGTYVNGKAMADGFLRSGDVIEFGPGGPKASITMEVVSVPQAASIQAARPAAPQAEREAAPVYAPAAQPVAPPVAPRNPPAAAAPRAEQLPATPREGAPLVIQYGPTIRSFRELPVTIGSHRDVDFVVKHPALRDQHAQFFFHQNGYWIRDLTGGLLTVNSRRVDEPLQLAPNDRIECSPQGPVFRFLGEGRLAEVDPETEQEQGGPAPDLQLADTSVKPASGSLFAKFVQGFKKQ